MFADKSPHVIVLLIIAPVMGTIGQTLLKLGMLRVGKIRLSTFDQIVKTIIQMIVVPEVLLAIPLYVAGFFLWLVILTKVDLSVAYPFLSLSYILIFLSSWLILGEEIVPIRWIGLGFVSIGLLFVGFSQ